MNKAQAHKAFQLRGRHTCERKMTRRLDRRVIRVARRQGRVVGVIMQAMCAAEDSVFQGE